jgi:hypothetical protein
MCASRARVQAETRKEKADETARGAFCGIRCAHRTSDGRPVTAERPALQRFRQQPCAHAPTASRFERPEQRWETPWNSEVSSCSTSSELSMASFRTPCRHRTESPKTFDGNNSVASGDRAGCSRAARHSNATIQHCIEAGVLHARIYTGNNGPVHLIRHHRVRQFDTFAYVRRPLP